MKKTQENRNRDIGIRRLVIAAVLSVLYCTILGIGILYYYFSPRGGGTLALEIPSFIGLEESEIGSVEGMEIIREWIYSDDVARGRVISQTPYANARRKVVSGQNYPVTLYISLGEKTEKIPYLCGVDTLSAAAALRNIGARVRTVAIYGDGEDGCVIGTSPDFDSEIRAGETVTLYVCKRRVKDPIVVPDFCGMTIADAVKLALSLGFFVCDCDGEGTVISQSLPKGARVMAESYICFETDGVAREREWPPVVK